ncbi:recombinase family protein [Streptomyces sp. NPDC057382]|uniref:recombinase family protein n=1 Tax=unclassified Streptomyces TaxID=2593676 RepID=UPI003631F0DC
MADQREIPPDDPEDPMRTAMRQMMGVFAQLDRGMTVAKLRRDRRIKAASRGRRASTRTAPRRRAGRPTRRSCPPRMEQAGRARARARQLRDEDELSLREICAVLEAEAIRPKRGERWHPETVRRMLANTSDRSPTLRRRRRTA